ncbi:MAG: ribosomal protein [Gammaproteobacteria bacterium]|jgi:large subunit ribosomal protein L3|nr:ribosomal protein [Gammaproteobacteria bacterium]
MTSLVGQKCGMTRVFTEDGTSTAVTVIQVLPNKVTQLKTLENDGYLAVQVTTGVRKRSRVNKPEAGHFAKANVEPGKGLWEFRLDSLDGMSIGTELKVDVFSEGQLVDITGTSIGKGYAGVIKRYNFAAQDATHGNSLSHRAPGSIGQRQSPGKVFKGKKMAGRLGNVKRTILSQKIVRIDMERNLILVSGGVPGAPGGYVVVRSAIKGKQKNMKESGDR